MIISLIAAIAENRAIGKDNQLLWHLPADMAFFKETTTGHCVLSGRKNYESIPEKFRPLKGRTNIVVTRNLRFKAPGAHVFPTIEAAISFAEEKGENELFVIGGAEIYSQILSQADHMYLTYVHASFEADAFFPEWNEEEWVCESSVFRPADERNSYDMTFRKYLNNKFL